MYGFVLFILVAIGIALAYYGVKKHHLVPAILGALLAVITIFFFWFLEFWGEMLWFQSLGYSQRFWTVFWTKIQMFFVGGIFGLVLVSALTWSFRRKSQFVRFIPAALGALFGAQWGLTNWETILRYLNSVSTDMVEPIFAKDTGFYLFRLPFYDALYSILFWLCAIGLISAFISMFLRLSISKDRFDVELEEESEERPKSYFPVYLNGAALIFVIAWGLYLERFHLLYSTLGAVTGAGWTDVNIRAGAYLIVSILTAILGVLLIVSPLRKQLTEKVQQKSQMSLQHSQLVLLGTYSALLLLIWFVALTAIPGIFQRFRVEPNEITFEKPYIANNIEFTRHGFKLHDVEEREFEAAETFTRSMIENNQELFANVRLWDWRALDAVYKQFQEIRLYYEFEDVDIDRYRIDDQYRQVMVSAREMKLENLPAQSQTFVNKRFIYTHGYGITLTTVHEFTPQGLPRLLIKDIPPQSTYQTLEVERPELYYGELTTSHVIVNSEQQEFDYPSGEENIYTRYAGKGGVQLSNFWRKFLYGWKFDGIQLILSGYPTSESRILFHRQIRERVKTLAPFLRFDTDPYIVLADGKLYWMIDGYTTSRDYPYSEPFSLQEAKTYRQTPVDRLVSSDITSALQGINYLRNSVKAVVDAYEGTVDFYVFDEEDALIQVWRNIFPDMFKPRSEMPDVLVNHIRYPVGMLLTQGLVYAKYHMTDPEVFYNQEDLWIRATEKYYNQVIPVEPYYIMWELPDTDNLEFTLILPFTPKKRQVMIGWIAGLSDPGNYGRMLAYKFPKEKRILGPQQVETKIDQDSYLSGQLTLWDQRGSNVIRGNVLAIPVENTIIYVEPIYLQAETAAYPELRLVAVMHDDDLSYAETFDQALEGLFTEQQPEIDEAAPIGDRTTATLIQDANTAFEQYLQALGESRFSDASQALDTLQQALQQLSSQSQLQEPGADQEQGQNQEQNLNQTP